MGSAFGPLMANTFICNVEEQLTNQNKMTAFYNRYVDDTLRKMRDISSASEVLSKLNEIHPLLSFTMELEDNGKLPFIGMVIIRKGPRLNTEIYVKPTNTAPLLYYQSHADVKYKHPLMNTMLDRAFKLSSNCQFFLQECERLKRVFTCLHYPEILVDSNIRNFIETKVMENACSKHWVSDEQDAPIRIVLPFKD